MTRYLLPLSLTLAGVAALTALPMLPAQAQQQDDLAAVSRAIRSISTLKARFSQTDRNGQVQNGTMLLKQPGKIRFQYDGDSLLIVADGKSLTMIDYDVRQVQRWPIKNSPLGALLDPSRDLSRYGTLVQTGDPRIVSVDVRDAAHPEYGVINLVFTRKPSAPAGLELYGWVAKDAQGNRTSIRLLDPAYGVAIADSAFNWRDPRPGARGPVR
jgi:outer membrane lipoprotein-sorting protein